jgi:hypothetical protein
LSGRAKLWIFIGALVGFSLLGFVGIFDLARSIFFSVLAVGLAIRWGWDLRRYAWFWAVIVAVALLHVAVIIAVPWSTRWIPAFALGGLMSLDLLGVLFLLTVVRRSRRSSPRSNSRGD